MNIYQFRNFLTLIFLINIFSGLSQSKLNSNNPNLQFRNSAHYFIENKGQWDEQVLFKSSFKGGNLWVQKSKLFFHLKDFAELRENHAGKKCDTCVNRQYALHINFKNCNEINRISKNEPSDEYYNYFIGSDSTKWAKYVRGYKHVTLYNLYNGIHLRLIQEDEVTKYEYIVLPNSSPNQIKLEIAGAKNIQLGAFGELIIKTPLGNIQEKKPFAYQIINSERKEIPCEFIIKDSTVFYKIGKYDHNTELIIDPELIFATYSGSITDNFGMTATYGHDGSAYSGGTIFGNSYPTPNMGVFNTNSNFTFVNNFSQPIASDIFISKYNIDGSKMIWTNFIGGGSNFDGAETVHSLICDKDDNLYAFGATSSYNFPTTTNAFQKKHHGGTTFSAKFNGANFGTNGVDIVCFQFSENGSSLNASTYLGGTGNDGVNANIFGVNNSYSDGIYYDSLTVNYGDQFRGEIMLDSLKNVYISTSTRSTDFPLSNPIINSLQGQQDGVIIKLDNNLSNLLFSTYIGGTNNDALYSVKLDSAYNIVFCGGTSSNDITTTPNCYQKNYGGGIADALIGKINQKNFSLKCLSYLGFDNYDQSYIVESDENNDVYLVGHSFGGKFPVINATYSNPNSSQFIVKFDSLLTKITQSTVYGSGNPLIRDASPAALLVDLCKNIYISSWGGGILTKSQIMDNMPVTSDALFSSPPNGFDFHLFSIDRDFTKINYGTYLGGKQADEHVDGGTSRFDRNGVVYQSICGGCGGHSDFPTTPNVWSNNNLSLNCNNIVLKFDFEIKAIPIIKSKDSVCSNSPIKLSNESKSYSSFKWIFDDGTPDNEKDLIISKLFQNPGKHLVILTVKNKYCNYYEITKQTINIVPNLLFLKKIDNTYLCKTDSVKFSLFTNPNPKYIFWSFDRNYSNILSKDKLDYKDLFTKNKTLYYKIADDYCHKNDSTDIIFKYPSFKLVGKTDVCENQNSTISVEIIPFSKKYTSNWFSSDMFESKTQNTIIINPKKNETYYGFKIITEDSCIISDSLKVISHKPLFNKIQLTTDKDTIFKGEKNAFFGTPNSITYIWQNVEKNINLEQNPLNTKPQNSRYYNVIANDGFCLYYDSIYINVIQDWECDFPYIFVPNAFSPNGDNVNEILYVRGRPIYDIEFRIFNRWGENIFTTFNVTDGWDGTYKGQKLPPDVYDYYLIVQCIDGVKKQFQGNITLLK